MAGALHISPEWTAAEARERLLTAGWRQVGAGDWAWVLADPEDALAARITPFDPGYLIFAEDCLAGPPNRWLPGVFAISPLQRSGYVAVMERLWPADPGPAAAFCTALGLASDSDEARSWGKAPPDLATDRDLAALRGRIGALLARGAARHRLWGGADIRPGNVMRDRAGGLKLVDAVFVAGRRIAAAIEAGRASDLAGFSPGELEDFLTIPVFLPGREGHEGADRLRRRLRDLARGGD
jgi:hypothetical protein